MTNGTSQGLFVIVAVVIFGIFIFISYLLFRDTLKPSLSTIFTDGLEQANCSFKKECPINVDSSREDGEYLYAKIRESNPKKNETEIWIQVEKLSDGTLSIDKSSTSDNNYTYGSPDMIGSLEIPDTIDGMKITNISKHGSGSFEDAEFSGSLKLPSSLNYIGESSFHSSMFTGELILPESITFVGEYAFYKSTFSGLLNLPNSLAVIGKSSFAYSIFSGELDVSHVNYIQDSAFSHSKIEKVIRGSVEMSDGSSEENISGINPHAIKLISGYYNGTNA
ncbi:TPA: leucine-rich repeat protein [Enterococcus faecium]|jgi:hypothetical protein|uniref:leucine-rich repeat protein n=1 Tax=unclassified Enterococcus TaxID=2608891 RepID=UPI003D2C35A8|nr:leucine-rich repeat protein [Enterococcus faecium]